MKRWLLLLPLSLFATVNDPIRCEIMTGYRNDRLHWHLQSPGDSGALSYSERYTNLNFWDNELVIRAIHRDLVLYLQGGYAAFGTGDLVQRYANLSYATDQPHLQFDNNSWAADAMGYVGYAVNLTAGRTYKFIVMPLLGYTAEFEQVRRQGTSQYSSDDAVGATSYRLDTRFPKTLNQTWYGFFVGGGLRFEPGGRMIFECGYAYNWLHLYFKTQFEETLFQFDGAALQTETQTISRVKTKSTGNLGQTGWASLEYWLDQAWRAGLAAQVRYFTSSVLTVNQKDAITPIAPAAAASNTEFPQKLKLRWTSISVFFTISRKF